jgi:hypothetical protein
MGVGISQIAVVVGTRYTGSPIFSERSGPGVTGPYQAQARSDKVWRVTRERSNLAAQ